MFPICRIFSEYFWCTSYAVMLWLEFVWRMMCCKNCAAKFVLRNLLCMFYAAKYLLYVVCSLIELIIFSCTKYCCGFDKQYYALYTFPAIIFRSLVKTSIHNILSCWIIAGIDSIPLLLYFWSNKELKCISRHILMWPALNENGLHTEEAQF